MAAHEATFQTRQEEIRQIWKDYRFFYQVSGGLVLVLIGVLIGAGLFGNDPGYGTNLYTEILSITVTVFVLNLLAERREEQRRIKDLQEQLVRDAGSTSNEIAKNAVHQLQKRKWLIDNGGLLKRVNLVYANLAGAKLKDASLEGTILAQADLAGADLRGANLERAILRDANLEGVNLAGANLAGADLRDANLEKVNLQNANLEGVNLAGTAFDENTILPDTHHDLGTDEYSSKWTPDTDMNRFTNPKCPDFWRCSDEKISPAYKDRSESKYRYF